MIPWVVRTSLANNWRRKIKQGACAVYSYHLCAKAKKITLPHEKPTRRAVHPCEQHGVHVMTVLFADVEMLCDRSFRAS